MNWDYNCSTKTDSIVDDNHHLVNYHQQQRVPSSRNYLRPDYPGHSGGGRGASSAARGPGGGSLVKFINDRRTSVISVATSIWHNRKTSVTGSTGSPNTQTIQNRALIAQLQLPHHDTDHCHFWDNYPLPPPSVTRQLAFGASDSDERGAVRPLGKTVLTAGCLAKLLAVLFVSACVLAVVLLRLKEFDLDQRLLEAWRNVDRIANVTTSTSQSGDVTTSTSRIHDDVATTFSPSRQTSS